MFFKPFTQFHTKRRVYLDYASSTPLDRAMIRRFDPVPGECAHANPHALHREGVALKEVLSQARSRVATVLGAHADEIIFTASATESDNLAIKGSINYFLQKGIAPEAIGVYTSPFEHSAVTESVASLSPHIFVCTLLQEDGRVTIKNLVIPEGIQAILVSVLMVQNEIGTLQPIKEIAKYIRKLRKDHPEVEIIFHTDATQAPLFYDLHTLRLGIDMMTLGATKLYCPKGVGVLYKKRSLKLSPLLYGGGQEFGLRPGTEPVALIHAFAHALSYAQNNRDGAIETISALQTYFESKVKERLPSIRITGGERAPHITHLVVPRVESELLVIELDARGIAVSSKSACKNEDESESEILSLLYPGERVGSIRISYGRMTTKKELNKAVKALSSVLRKYSL